MHEWNPADCGNKKNLRRMKRLLQRSLKCIGLSAALAVFTLVACKKSEPPSPALTTPPREKPAAAAQTADSAPSSGTLKINHITISPAAPKVTDTLKAEVSPASLGPDVTYHYQWYVNGRPLSGEVQSTLTPGPFTRGDKLTCEVAPVGTKGDGKTVLSPAVEVVNAPPVFQSVTIEPERPNRKSGITVKVTATDPDGDRVDISQEWTLNGAPFPQVREATLPGEHLKRGMIVWARVTASDGKDRVERASEVYRVGNAPPDITSTPPDLGKGIKTYQYQVTAVDLDGDAVEFSLQGPEGATISPTGLVTWEPKSTQGGLQHFQISAKDKEGAAGLQNFDIMVNLAPAPAPTPAK